MAYDKLPPKFFFGASSAHMLLRRLGAHLFANAWECVRRFLMQKSHVAEQSSWRLAAAVTV